MDSFLVILGIALYIVFFVAKKKKENAAPPVKRPMAAPMEPSEMPEEDPPFTVATEADTPAPAPQQKAADPDIPVRPAKRKSASTGLSLKKDIRKAIIYSEIIKRKY